MKSIKTGQIPSWRPGAVYWKPLPDGREVTIYPLIYGKARFCVGPLADPKGYDVGYRYASIDAATKAAEVWDSEGVEHPPGFEAIDFNAKLHRQKSVVHSSAIQVGSKLELNSTAKSIFDIEEIREMGGERTTYVMQGWTEDEMYMYIEAVRELGDPVGNDGDPLVTITGVNVKPGDQGRMA